VAVHLACQSLLAQECDMALAGAANIIVPQNRGYLYREGLIFSSDGHCRAFDAQADGTMLGSGAGIVLLKRLEDALADHDPIYAVIRSTAINNDGAAKMGYPAPSVEGQASVIAEAQAIAEVHPATIGYLEAHGTATNLGDPIEITALSQVFRASTTAKQFCAIGSVKTNLGHLSKAAGIAGLIKATLALKHELIPPSLHYTTPNPQIDFANSPFFVNTTLRPWPRPATHPRRAGVSAFGTGGTNAHVVLEEAPLPHPNPPLLGEGTVPSPSRGGLGWGSGWGEAGERPWQLLTLSAKSDAALAALAQNLATHLQETPPPLADVAYTLQTGRRHFDRRRALVCRCEADAIAQLTAPAPAALEWDAPPKIAFLFTGQGPQRVAMGKQLYETAPLFREIIDHCSEILQPHLGLSLLDLLYGTEQATADQLLNEATYAQPALFAIEYALAQLWRSWGIEPAVVVGHSMGEYAAACVAGVFSLADGLKLIAARGRLMQTSAQAGQMMAVLGNEQAIQQILQPFAAQVSLAVINTTESMVISGQRDAVREAAQALRAAGIKTKELKIFVASHSPLMEPILAEFAQVLRSVTLAPPTLQVVSNVTGQVIHDELTTVDYWLRHLRQPVRFADGMATLDALCVNVFIETGPAPVLLGLGQECLPAGATRLWLPSLQPQKEDWAQLLTTLGALYERQTPIDWRGFYQHEERRRLSLPTYPFQRKVCWIEPGNAALQGKPHANGQPGTHPLLGQRVRSALKHKEILFETQISAQSPAYLADYRVQQTVMLPATAYIEIALAAGAAVDQSGTADGLALADLTFPQALVLPEDGSKTLQCVVTPPAATMDATPLYTFQLFSLADDEWVLHAGGAVQRRPADSISATTVSRQTLQAGCPQAIAVADHYQKLGTQGLTYGERFRVLTQLWLGPDAAFGAIHLPQPLITPTTYLHPVLLDGCLQILGAALPAEEMGWRYRIAGLTTLQLYRRAQPAATGFYGHAVVRGKEGDETLLADLHLWDEAGVLAAITGLILKRTAHQPMNDSHGAANGVAPVASFRQQLAATPAAEQQALLSSHLRSQLAAVLGLDEPERIGLRQGLFDLGLDSLLSIALRNRLQATLGQPFRATLVFDYPTLEALTRHISETVLPTLAQSATPSPQENPSALVAAVTQLSATAVEDALAAELEALEALLA
jgi:malonyl CoA-acyl carrier protein transacylase